MMAAAAAADGAQQHSAGYRQRAEIELVPQQSACTEPMFARLLHTGKYSQLKDRGWQHHIAST